MSKMMEIILKTSHPKVEEPLLILDSLCQEQLDQQIKELGIKVQQGEGATADRRELYMLLNLLLSYPCTSQAEIHRKANRLGLLDINQEERYRCMSSKTNSQHQQFTNICKCCGFIVQEKGLSTCIHSIEDIHNLGISTFLYFKMIINVSVLLGIMLFVYSIYTFITNIQASNLSIDGNYSSTALNFLSISLGSKQLYGSSQKQEMYIIGAWIGCGMLIVWGVAVMALKYYQKQKQVNILMETKSVSEFSLVIENIPAGLSRAEVQREFKEYLKEIKEKEQTSVEKLEVMKYNEGQPFYFNESEFQDAALDKELEMTKIYLNLFKSWIEERREHNDFKKTQKFRKRKYTEYQRVVERKKKIINQITSKIKQKYQEKHQEHLTTAFVTFATNHQKNFILDHNPNNLISRIKNSIPCFRSKNRFSIKKGDTTFSLRIYPAPTPQDIVWSNIGVSQAQIWARKFLTYSITSVILCISFVIAYSLSSAQVNQSNQALSFTISISTSVINIIIGLVIEVLTSYERDYTMTNYQLSLTFKTVLAQLINSIFIPIIANYFIKQNIYEQNGLIEDVFILGITNSLIYPLAKLINPSYLAYYFYGKYKLRPTNKLDLHQYQINQLHQKQQFQVGYQHIYIVNLFIFTCFFVSLQPILPIFALVGMLLIYWIQKYTLFNRCQRPIPGTPIIDTAVSQMVYFGPVAYTLGSMTWANFLPQSQFEEALLPNLFALSAALIIFLLPYQTIFRSIFSSKRMPQIFYSQSRIFFTAEYDRLNPSTSQGGVKQYYSFLQNKIKQLQNEDLHFKSRLSYQLQSANRPNFYKQPFDLYKAASKYEGKAIIQNLLKKQSKNSMTPQMIASVLMKDYSRPMAQVKSRIQQSLAKIKSQQQKYTDEKEQIKPTIVQEQESNKYLQDLQKIESFKIQNLGRASNFTYNKQLNESDQYQQYFQDIAQVKSYVLKADQKRTHQQIKKPQGQGYMQFIIKKDSVVNSHQQRNPRQAITYEEYMRSNSLKHSIDLHDEVPNRFSLNSQNILPLCLQSQSLTSSIEENHARLHHLASFQ